MNTSALDILKGEYLPDLEALLRAALNYHADTINTSAHMLHYHMGWEAHQKQVGSVGKRTRPLITLLSADASGGHWRDALPLAGAVELVHNFSLIHDDIQDESELRRGRPTLWVLSGKPQAINAGDALFVHAHLVVQRATVLPVETRLQALSLLDQSCLELTDGQHCDLEFENAEYIDQAAYWDMVSGKTASLIAVAAEIGALAAGATEEQCEHYRAFGHALGLAYQVRDDILGIWGERDSTGKPTDSDLRARKKTLPVIIGMNRSAEFRDLYLSATSSDEYVHHAVRLLQECGARVSAQEIEREQVELALSSLTAARPVGQAGDALQAMAHQLLERTN